MTVAFDTTDGGRLALDVNPDGTAFLLVRSPLQGVPAWAELTAEQARELAWALAVHVHVPSTP